MDKQRCCEKWIVRKNRNCTVPAVPGTNWCQHHIPVGSTSEHEQSSYQQCRFCLTFISPKSFNRHVSKLCPIMAKEKKLQEQPYFSRDVNATSLERRNVSTSQNKDSSVRVRHALEDNTLLYNKSPIDPNNQSTSPSSPPPENPPDVPIGLLEIGKFLELQRKIESACSDLPEVKLDVKHCDELSSLLESSSSKSHSLRGVKHTTQQDSIIAHLLSEGFLSEELSDCCVVEMGAGKAELSFMIRQIRNVDVVAVDMQNFRRKCDRFFTSKDETRKFDRIRVNLRHLDLRKVSSVSGKRVVAVSKHLCGSGTDYALRCLLNTRSPVELDDSGNSGSSNSSFEAKNVFEAAGLVIATCCHHRCSWESYCNRDFFSSIGFSRSDFSAILKISTWATCGHRQAEPKADEKSDTTTTPQIAQDVLTPESKASLGHACKRLLDHGRALMLQEAGFSARVVYYCDKETTQENRLLIAVK
eukprot:914763_1